MPTSKPSLITHAVLAKPRATVAVGPRPWQERAYHKAQAVWGSDWMLVPMAAGLVALFAAGALTVAPPSPSVLHGAPSASASMPPVAPPSPPAPLPPSAPTLPWPDAQLLALTQSQPLDPGQAVAVLDRLEAQWAQAGARQHEEALWQAVRQACIKTADARYEQGGEVPGDVSDWFPEQRFIQQWRRQNACDEVAEPAAPVPRRPKW